MHPNFSCQIIGTQDPGVSLCTQNKHNTSTCIFLNTQCLFIMLHNSSMSLPFTKSQFRRLITLWIALVRNLHLGYILLVLWVVFIQMVCPLRATYLAPVLCLVKGRQSSVCCSFPGQGLCCSPARLQVSARGSENHRRCCNIYNCNHNSVYLII